MGSTEVVPQPVVQVPRREARAAAKLQVSPRPIMTVLRQAWVAVTIHPESEILPAPPLVHQTVAGVVDKLLDLAGLALGVLDQGPLAVPALRPEALESDLQATVILLTFRLHLHKLRAF